MTVHFSRKPGAVGFEARVRTGGKRREKKRRGKKKDTQKVPS